MIRSIIIAAATLGLAASAAAQNMTPRDVDAQPSSKPTLTARYGPDALEFGDLRLPAGKGPFPTAVVVHGGCYTKGFATLTNTAPLASALTAKGVATWNVEYRQAGDPGGGWPGTFQDWAAATDYLRVLARTQPIDLKRVTVIGHSAGATAATWVASRGKLPGESAIRGADPLPVQAFVAIDGPEDITNLVGLDAQVCGKPVIVPFMGGAPAEQPQRYVEANAAARLPLHVRQYFVASVVLPGPLAQAYRAKAAAAGDAAEVLEVQNGGHFDIIAPDSKAGREVMAFILDRAVSAPR